MAPMDALLSVQDLAKAHGDVRAVEGLSFTIGRGEIIGLLGPNGAGKSTTISCLLGLLVPDAGHITVLGRDVVRERAWVAERVGAQLQATALVEGITVTEALTLFGSFYDHAATVADLVAETGLTGLERRRFGTLSPGERQRLALALALVNQPALLVLDEPTAGMDPHARRDLHACIRARAAAGAGVLLATQTIEEAERLCHRVLILDRGRCIADGPPAALVATSDLPTRVVLTTARPWDAAPWGGTTVTEGEGHVVLLTTRTPTRILAEVLPVLAAAGNDLHDLRLERPTLEDVFCARTGRRLP